MDDLIFISAQPHDVYFQWQIEVQITNFRKFGISNKMHILIWHPQGSTELPAWRKIQQKYPEVKIYFYVDQGVNLALYQSQLRPHILKRYFNDFAEMIEGKTIFYHDSDIIFNFLPNFSSLIEGNTCWQSDCSGYLDYRYLRNKEIEGNIPEHEAISLLAKIGGVTVEDIRAYEGKTGGAQVVLKNIDSSFWDDIEKQVVEIRRKFFFNIPGSINRKYFSKEDAGFQSWCADMWALNFALWNRGIETDVTKELDFSWATDSANTYKLKPIMHNAGAISGIHTHLFCKSDWMKASPIGQPLKVQKNSASFYYVRAIADTILTT